MTRSSQYGERDYAFGQRILTLRTTMGFTQERLSHLLGISRRALSEWESGSSYPKAAHLKAFIRLCMKERVFSRNLERNEAHDLWKAAHQKVILDEQWLSTVLTQEREPAPDLSLRSHAAGNTHADWGEAQMVSTFYGRDRDIACITHWIVRDHIRLVCIVGMGGIGKSALAVRLMHQLSQDFEAVLFRSLRDAPTCEELLESCLRVLAPHQLSNAPPNSLEEYVFLLLTCLQKQRILLVLDNLEALMEIQSTSGSYRPGYDAYKRLFSRIVQTPHQSSLLLTSRERPIDPLFLVDSHTPVRVFRLTGLDLEACASLFADKAIIGTEQEQTHLVETYAGNPLALHIVTELIADLFAGQIGLFLCEGTGSFGSITDLLAEHFNRLSSLEHTVIRWLAIVREPISLDELLALFVIPLPRLRLLEALDSLRRRSLVEQGQLPASFLLQGVVLEYATTRLITEMVHQVQLRKLTLFSEVGWELATSREYVYRTQQRLILFPILAVLRQHYPGRGELEAALCSLLQCFRERAEYAQGYGPANLLALFREERGHLKGLDLSRLVIRAASFQGVEMQDSSLAEATLSGTILTQAFDTTWTVAVSPDGLRWATGSWRGEVHIWCEEGQVLQRVWLAHTDNINTLAFSPDGHLLATGSWDSTVKLWDLEQDCLLWIRKHTDMVRSVAFSPDGATLASGSIDGTIQCREVCSGNLLQVLCNPGGAVYAVAWHPQGQILASGSLDGSIWLWHRERVEFKNSLHMPHEHTNWVVSLAFSPDGRLLASASWDSTVKLWDLANNHLFQTLTGHTQLVRAVTWSPDGRILASVGHDVAIRLWDLKERDYRTFLQGHTGTVYAAAFSPDGRHLLSSSGDGTLRVWEVMGGACARIVHGSMDAFSVVEWSPDGRQLASASIDGGVRLWDVENRIPPRTLRGHHWSVYGVSWSPDGKRLASGGWDNSLRVWNVKSGREEAMLQDTSHTDTIFTSVAWSPDGNLLASGTYMHGVQVWDWKSGVRCWIDNPHPTRVNRIAWSPDGSLLVSGGDDGHLYLWEGATGELCQHWKRPQSAIADVAWSSDGRRLVSGGKGSQGGEICIWECGQEHVIQEIYGQKWSISAIEWGKQDEMILSGGSDGVLRWWMWSQGVCVRRQEGHVGTIRSLRMSPDRHLLVSAGYDNTMHIWDERSGQLLQKLRQDRPYERLNIRGIKGLTSAQKESLRSLGAVE